LRKPFNSVVLVLKLTIFGGFWTALSPWGKKPSPWRQKAKNFVFGAPLFWGVLAHMGLFLSAHVFSLPLSSLKHKRGVTLTELTMGVILF